MIEIGMRFDEGKFQIIGFKDADISSGVAVVQDVELGSSNYGNLYAVDVDTIKSYVEEDEMNINWDGFTNEMYDKMNADLEAGLIPRGGADYGTIMVGKREVSVLAFTDEGWYVICLASRKTRQSIHMQSKGISYLQFRLEADKKIKEVEW